MKLYTPADVAQLKGVTRGAVDKAVANGLLKPSVTTNGTAKRFFDEKAVQQYLRVRAGRPVKRRGSGGGVRQSARPGLVGIQASGKVLPH